MVVTICQLSVPISLKQKVRVNVEVLTDGLMRIFTIGVFLCTLGCMGTFCRDLFQAVCIRSEKI